MESHLYVAHASVENAGSLHRRGRIATGVTVDFGVHGPIKEFYHLQPERELPLPVDYIVAATGG